MVPGTLPIPGLTLGKSRMTGRWSKEALPIGMRSTGLFFWVVAPAAWIAFLLFGWLVVLPDADDPSIAQAALIITVMLICLLVVWLIKLVRQTFRTAVQVTSDGVEIARGQTREFDSYLQCSNFGVFGWTLQWKARTERGVRLRTIAGLNFGMSRKDVKALCALLNALREAAVAQAQFG